MTRKAKVKRPAFQPIPIAIQPHSNPEPQAEQSARSNIYVRSTHYTSQPDGTLTTTAETLVIQDLHTDNTTSENVEEDAFLETDFSVYLSTLNDDNTNSEQLEQPVNKKRRVVSLALLVS